MEFNPQDQIVLDEEKLKKLQLRIYLLERENYKTKKLKDNEVVEKIIKLIILDNTKKSKLSNFLVIKRKMLR